MRKVYVLFVSGLAFFFKFYSIYTFTPLPQENKGELKFVYLIEYFPKIMNKWQMLRNLYLDFSLGPLYHVLFIMGFLRLKDI